MDYTKYYQSQAKGEDLSVFKGRPYMRGYGFGNVFKKFFRWISPIVKENALPVLKNIGKEGLRTAASIANETLDGKDFSESAKSNLKKSITKLSNQYGSGRKRKKSIATKKKIKFSDSSVVKNIQKLDALRNTNKKKKKKRDLDIFDNVKISNPF